MERLIGGGARVRIILLLLVLETAGKVTIIFISFSKAEALAPTAPPWPRPWLMFLDQTCLMQAVAAYN